MGGKLSWQFAGMPHPTLVDPPRQEGRYGCTEFSNIVEVEWSGSKDGTKWRLNALLVFCALARRRKWGIIRRVLMWTLA